MSVPFNTDWMQRAFLKIEAALLERIATHAARNITEETLRDALYQGLTATEPLKAHLVHTETPLAWHNNQCSFCNQHPGQGGSKRHDVSVEAHPDNPGLLCEVKWIKSNQYRAGQVMSDALRLILSRSCAPEGQAIRTYLLVGGESKPFGRTLQSLREAGLNLRWSPAGKQSTADAMPEAKQIIMGSLLHRSKLGFQEFEQLMLFGRGHYRAPPSVWRHMKISVRARWLQTSSGRSWRMALWELSHWGVGKKNWRGDELARKFRGLHQRRRRKKVSG